MPILVPQQEVAVTVLPPLVVADDLPDGLDQAAIDAAVGVIRAYCGWHIAPSVTEVMIRDGSGGAEQLLPTLRLTALSSITNDGVTIEDPEWSEAGMVRAYCWTRKYRGVVATMTHGYDACPPELVSAVATLASYGMSGQAKQMQAGPFSITLAESQMAGAIGMSPALRSVLDLYRLPPRP